MAALIPLVIWRTGQSNSWGINVGETLSRADIPYWDTLLSSLPGSDAFHSLSGSHISGGGGGADATMGRILKDAGYDVIIINISRGATYSNQWVNGGFVEPLFAAEAAEALAALNALRPGANFRHVHIRDIGEQDVRNPSSINASTWNADNTTFHNNLTVIVGKPVAKICIYTNYTLDGALWSSILRTDQTAWAGGVARCINRDGLEYESDGVHLTSAGYIALGGLIAAKIQELYPMGNFTSAARDIQLKHELNVAAYSPPATHYMHLYAAGSVPLTPGNAPGYTVTSFANNTTTWPAPSGRAMANGIAFTTTAPSGTWPDVAEVRITDSATEGAGTTIATDILDTPQPINTGTGAFSVAIGNFTVTCPAGGFVDAIAHRMMGLVLGGVTYTAPTQKWISYYAGNPQSGGTIVGSRVAMTMASTFAAASGGYAYTNAAISLPHQATGTFIAVHDAAAAGNLVFSAARPNTLGLTGTIPAGLLRVGVT